MVNIPTLKNYFCHLLYKIANCPIQYQRTWDSQSRKRKCKRLIMWKDAWLYGCSEKCRLKAMNDLLFPKGTLSKTKDPLLVSVC